jgi:hypothetical protein
MRAMGEISDFAELYMPALRMDDGLSQLNENILDKSSAQDEYGHPEADRGKRCGGSTLVAYSIACGKLDERGWWETSGLALLIGRV